MALSSSTRGCGCVYGVGGRGQTFERLVTALVRSGFTAEASGPGVIETDASAEAVLNTLEQVDGAQQLDEDRSMGERG